MEPTKDQATKQLKKGFNDGSKQAPVQDDNSTTMPAKDRCAVGSKRRAMDPLEPKPDAAKDTWYPNSMKPVQVKENQSHVDQHKQPLVTKGIRWTVENNFRMIKRWNTIKMVFDQLRTMTKRHKDHRCRPGETRKLEMSCP